MEQHFLSSYYHAILSVILAQFSSRGCSDGMEGIVQLVKASPHLKVRACIKARKALVQSICVIDSESLFPTSTHAICATVMHHFFKNHSKHICTQFCLWSSGTHMRPTNKWSVCFLAQ